MVIESYEKRYQVLSLDGVSEEKELYTCEQEGSLRKYRIIRLKDHALVLRVLAFLMEEKKKGTLADLVEVFSNGQDLCVVFAAAEGREFLSFLEEEPSLKERIQVGHNVLEKLVLYDMPPYFMCQNLSFEHILVEEDLSVGFSYTLDVISEYQNFTEKQAQMYVYHFLSSLFQVELARKTVDAMEAFLKELLKGKYTDNLAVFKQYEQAAALTLQIPGEELRLPKTKFFQFWQKLKKGMPFFKKLLFVLVYAGVFVYMIYCLVSCNQVKGYEQNFESIGTLEIKGEAQEGQTDIEVRR